MTQQPAQLFSEPLQPEHSLGSSLYSLTGSGFFSPIMMSFVRVFFLSVKSALEQLINCSLFIALPVQPLQINGSADLKPLGK